MTTISLLLFGILPAVLVVLGGWQVSRSGMVETAARRTWLFLLAADYGVLLMEILIGLSPSTHGQNNWEAASLGLPTSIGLLVWLLTHYSAQKGAGRMAGILTILSGLGNLAVMIVVWTSGETQMVVVGTLFCLAVIWMLSKRFDGVAILLGLVCLACLIFLFQDGNPPAFTSSNAIGNTLLNFFFYVLPGLAIVLAAALIHSSIRRMVAVNHKGLPAKPVWVRYTTAFRFLLAVLLIGTLAYTIYWAAIWDQTSDEISGIWYAIQASVVAIGAGILMGISTIGKPRLVGLGYAVIIPVIMFSTFSQPWGIHLTITAQRAAEIQKAVINFQARTGRYPATLQELVPRELLSIPNPVILRGENWCYQFGNDYYQLGAIFRENFYSPLSFRVYASAGGPPSELSSCENRLPELKAHYDLSSSNGGMENGSTAADLSLVK